MEAWWIRYPDELGREQCALDALGYSWSIDQVAMDAGQMIVRVEVVHDGGTLALTATYPDSYPYFAPMVTADDAKFARHQHPLGRNLCLLAREGEDWYPGQDSLATLITEQLPAVLAVNREDALSEQVASIEDHVGEPLSSFLPYTQDCVLIVPDGTPPLSVRSGRLELSLREVPPQFNDRCFVSGVVKSVCDVRSTPLVRFETTIPPFNSYARGYWARLDVRPVVSTITAAPQEVFNQAAAVLPELVKAIQAAKRGDVIVVGLVYPDEVSWRTTSDDWIFLAVRVTREARRSQPPDVRADFIRADWGGERAWMRRAPFLTPLRKKRALVVGLGSLGSPLCLQLAKAGIGELRVIDFDVLQVGNTIRWGLGWQYAGFQKTTAVMAHIANEYPYTAASGYNLRIGGVRQGPWDRTRSEYAILRQEIQEADIIVDAAANHRVSHFLADLASEVGKPYVWLTTTHGAAGGIVGRVQPTRTDGCWHCFLRNLADGSIRLPVDEGTDEIQPGGCSQPTFIGAGIDSDAIAHLAARLTVATLNSEEEHGYPDFSWDVAVGDLRRAHMSLAPEWTTYSLGKRHDCAACGTRV
ncbi:ThiF family adenylyltransferase [Paraburkholderia sp. C35]|uniref:ThiF family adenylyltransferase n=1 Tax=Paraburkholderia sp. C35 TaxID=2126993 RepID=UPI000D69B493|nr:ThiF family adenylyltransferase [Paraburkholderia sp. C35]